MSAFPDEPTHLLRWLSYNRNELTTFLPSEVDASTFIPRQLYGLYIQSILEEAEATAESYIRLERLSEQEVVAVEPVGNGALVSLHSGLRFLANKVVLALGNSPSSPLASWYLNGNNERL